MGRCKIALTDINTTDKIGGVALADAIKSLDWKERNAEFADTASKEEQKQNKLLDALLNWSITQHIFANKKAEIEQI